MSHEDPVVFVLALGGAGAVLEPIVKRVVRAIKEFWLGGD